MLVTELHRVLKDAKASMFSNFAADKRPETIFEPVVNMRKNAFEKKKKAGTMKREEEHFESDVISRLEEFLQGIKSSGKASCEEGFEVIKQMFAKDVEKREEIYDNVGDELDNAFNFIEFVFGQSQEMVVFVTELNAGYYSIKFIDEHGCVKFYQYNKNLLFKERQRKIISDIDEINEMVDSLKQSGQLN